MHVRATGAASPAGITWAPKSNTGTWRNVILDCREALGEVLRLRQGSHTGRVRGWDFRRGSVSPCVNGDSDPMCFAG